MALQRVEFKLREARYFLGMMEDEAARPAAQEREQFRYVLSAFLAAADSVTDAGEIDDPAFNPYRLKVWKRNLNPDQLELVEFMEKQRDEEIHRSGADVVFEPRVTPGQSRLRDQYTRTPIAAIIADAQTRGVEVNLADVYPDRLRFEWVFRGLGSNLRRVVQACGRYLELLEKLARDFERRPTL